MSKRYFYRGRYELYHHGIKGQKWGIRRWQYEDGRFNEEGKERYFGKTKEQISLKTKLSDPRVKRAIKIGVAVAATALVAYGGYKLYKSNRTLFQKDYGLLIPKGKFDQNEKLSTLLKTHPDAFSDNPINLQKGTIVQRISREGFEDFTKKGETYVSFKFRDNMAYKHGLPKELIWKSKDAYVHKIELKENIKAPSTKELVKIYSELFPEGSYSNFKLAMQNGFVNNLYSSQSNDLFGKLTKQQNEAVKKELIKRGFNECLEMQIGKFFNNEEDEKDDDE